MGASAWEYFVPYQEDLNQALRELRSKVFDTKSYWWYGDEDWLERPVPRPQRLEDVFEDEFVQESGTHSILDIVRVAPPGTPLLPVPYGAIVPTSADELRAAVGTDKPTRADTEALDKNIDRHRWVGRSTTLYDAAGVPAEIMFWGHSGD
jgi:hypothetical protein